jgi:hypothetical protein
MAGLWYFVKKVFVLPVGPKDLAEHNKKEMAVKRILLDLVKDHLIPLIVGKKTAKEMYNAQSLISLGRRLPKRCIMPWELCTRV